MRRRTISGCELIEMPPRVEASLWRRFRYEAETTCRAQIFDRYRVFARAIAQRQLRSRPSHGIELPDIEQLAYEGLLQAIDRFDPLRGVPFLAFARRRIVGSISDGAARFSEFHAQYSYRRRAAAERARSIGFDGADSLTALADLATGLAIGVMLEDDGRQDIDSRPDDQPNAYESLAWREICAILRDGIAQLPERKAFIIREHYLHDVSFTQISQLLEISKGRVSQLHAEALKQLADRIGDREKI